MDEITRTAIEERARQILAEMPPLTQAQRDRCSALLWPRTYTSTAATSTTITKHLDADGVLLFVGEPQTDAQWSVQLSCEARVELSSVPVGEVYRWRDAGLFGKPGPEAVRYLIDRGMEWLLVVGERSDSDGKPLPPRAGRDAWPGCAAHGSDRGPPGTPAAS